MKETARRICKIERERVPTMVDFFTQMDHDPSLAVTEVVHRGIVPIFFFQFVLE